MFVSSWFHKWQGTEIQYLLCLVFAKRSPKGRDGSSVQQWKELKNFCFQDNNRNSMLTSALSTFGLSCALLLRGMCRLSCSVLVLTLSLRRCRRPERCDSFLHLAIKVPSFTQKLQPETKICHWWFSIAVACCLDWNSRFAEPVCCEAGGS